MKKKNSDEIRITDTFSRLNVKMKDIARGRDLGGTGGIVPLKKLGGGTDMLLSPPNI